MKLMKDIKQYFLKLNAANNNALYLLMVCMLNKNMLED